MIHWLLLNNDVNGSKNVALVVTADQRNRRRMISDPSHQEDVESCTLRTRTDFQRHPVCCNRSHAIERLTVDSDFTRVVDLHCPRSHIAHYRLVRLGCSRWYRELVGSSSAIAQE